MLQCTRNLGAMDTKRLLGDTAFEPDDIVRMTSAYNLALRELGLVDRDDPLTETVAKKVIEIMLTGERDPVLICEFAIRQLRTASVIH
jgi:hypothetical protein